MDIVIGIQHSTRELRLDVDGKPDEVRDQIEKAFAEEAPILWLTDTDGRQVGVPVSRLAYVEVGADLGSKQMGFAVSVEKSKG